MLYLFLIFNTYIYAKYCAREINILKIAFAGYMSNFDGERSDENEIDKDGPWKSQRNMLTSIEDIEGQWRSTHQNGRGVLARSPEDGIREEGIRNQRQLY